MSRDAECIIKRCIKFATKGQLALRSNEHCILLRRSERSSARLRDVRYQTTPNKPTLVSHRPSPCSWAIARVFQTIKFTGRARFPNLRLDHVRIPSRPRLGSWSLDLRTAAKSPSPKIPPLGFGFPSCFCIQSPPIGADQAILSRVKAPSVIYSPHFKASLFFSEPIFRDYFADSYAPDSVFSSSF